MANAIISSISRARYSHIALDRLARRPAREVAPADCVQSHTSRDVLFMLAEDAADGPALVDDYVRKPALADGVGGEHVLFLRRQNILTRHAGKCPSNTASVNFLDLVPRSYHVCCSLLSLSGSKASLDLSQASPLPHSPLRVRLAIRHPGLLYREPMIALATGCQKLVISRHVLPLTKV